MDYAASHLETILILGAPLPARYVQRIRSAIKLLRHPPTKNRGMQG